MKIRDLFIYGAAMKIRDLFIYGAAALAVLSVMVPSTEAHAATMTVSVPTMVSDDGDIISTQTTTLSDGYGTASQAQSNSTGTYLDDDPPAKAAATYNPVHGYLYCCSRGVVFSESWQMPIGTYKVCMDPVHGSAAGGVAKPSATLTFILYRKVTGGWQSFGLSNAYFGLDKQYHYWCWSNVPAGYVNTGDNYIHYNYAIGYTGLRNTTQAHVGHYIHGWGGTPI